MVNKIIKSNKDIDRVSQINWELNLINDDKVVNAMVSDVIFCGKFCKKNIVLFAQ